MVLECARLRNSSPALEQEPPAVPRLVFPRCDTGARVTKVSRSHPGLQSLRLEIWDSYSGLCSVVFLFKKEDVISVISLVSRMQKKEPCLLFLNKYHSVCHT